MTTEADEPSGMRTSGTGPGGAAGLAARVDQDVAMLDTELAEIDLLIQQASAERERHEAKRASLEARIAAAHAGGIDPLELADQNAQLVNLTRRATVMEAQVDVLNGKAKVLRRYRDGIAAIASDLRVLSPAGAVPPVGSTIGGDAGAGQDGDPAAFGVEVGESGARVSPEISRMILAAQEDLRRDIARAMHDGPAQSLTNIVLQAQVVERLVASDPAAARPETRELIAMVQSTLEATKSFIFDVRPMVLDDLGLVPTVRRAARDRGRRAGITVDFDSMGADRRLSADVESGVFRIVDESIAGYLAGSPDQVVVRLDWTQDSLEAIIWSTRDTGAPAAAEDDAPGSGAGDAGGGRGGRLRARSKPEPEMPAALAAMIDERRTEQAAAEAATVAPIPLPAKSWRAIQARAATLGARADLSEDGSQVRVLVSLSAGD
jgi:two-component system, NarL family, sensor histidine kinase DegS